MAKKKLKLPRVLRRLGITTFYQRKRVEGTEERWRLIDANLADGDRSLFDVGCNVGQFTARAARRGMFSVGADVQLGAVVDAIKTNGGQANLAFGNWPFSPDNITVVPPFDVILCLSVHHYWHRAYGEQQCWDMVRHLARNAGKFFFEPSVRLKKYGKTPPKGFVEGNSAHLEARIREEITGPLDKNLAFLGETEAPGDERFRPLFLIT